MDNFTFAGFKFPRAIAQLPAGSPADRKGQRRYCGPYTHAPRPNANKGGMFYLDSDFMPAPRYELTGAGYRFSEFGDSIEGVIFRLPKGRGFLAGWTMGRGMIGEYDSTLHDDEASARRAADDEAERAAEREAEYEAQENERLRLESDIESQCAELDELRAEHTAAIYAREHSTDAAHFIQFGHSAATVRDAAAEVIETIRDLRRQLECLQ